MSYCFVFNTVTLINYLVTYLGTSDSECESSERQRNESSKQNVSDPVACCLYQMKMDIDRV